LDNLLYSSDVFFSCFADLALVSPVEYYKAGEGSLMQVVITPAQVSKGRNFCQSNTFRTPWCVSLLFQPYMSWTNEAIAKEADKQVHQD
jgi:zeta-carotene desaturase